MAGLQPTNRYIYGDISKKFTPVQYTGKDTDTLEIVVDNNKATISGNVKWQTFLGETENTAYPGDKGAIHQRRILEIAKELSDEIKRATSIENALAVAFNNETRELQQKNVELTTQLLQLSDLLNTYIASAENVVAKEASRAIAAETDISTRITDAVAAQQAINAELTSDIIGESNRAILSEKELSNSIHQNTEAITSLQNSLETTTSTAEDKITEAVTTITAKLDEEISARESSNQELIAQINDVNSKIISVNSDLMLSKKDFEDKVSTVSDKANENFVALASELGQESLDRQFSDTELSLRIDALVQQLSKEISRSSQEDSTLSKRVNGAYNALDILDGKIDTKTTELADTLQQQYTIIASELGRTTEELQQGVMEAQLLSQKAEHLATQETQRAMEVMTEVSGDITTLDATVKAYHTQYTEDIEAVLSYTTNRCNELEERIDSGENELENIDFIDGGKAPISQM